MEINVNMKSNLRIQAFYIFFIIASLQTGVGIMGAPRVIYTEAQHDAWISIIIALAYILIVLFVMFLILKQYENTDIFGIQVDIFGTWLGKLLGTVYIIYFAATLLSIVLIYIEVVKIFIFPELSTLLMGILLVCLIIYTVLGGFRVIVGVCFLFFILSHWLLFLLIEPALYIDSSHFQPVLQASFVELLKGAKATSYSFVGFEILFLVYPFIQNKEKIKLPTYLATCLSAILLLITTIIAIGFFSPVQLERREWSVLALFKIQSFSFIERFDYIVVAEWMMVTVPNMVLLTWGVTYGMKRLYKVKQKITLYTVAVLLLLGCTFINEHFQIQKVINTVVDYGFWLVYVYPFLLLPLVLFKTSLRKRKGDGSNAN